MYNMLFILTAIVAVCSSQETAKQPVRCGETPYEIYACLGNPRLMPAGVSGTCKSDTECQRLTCVFEKSGWLKEGKVDKTVMRRYFDEYATQHPLWRKATEAVKAECVGDVEIQPQGIYVSCPAYDVLHCALTKFFKNADPAVWQSGPACDAARQFAELCPVCPEDCFVPAIPIGVCNACRLLPRSP